MVGLNVHSSVTWVICLFGMWVWETPFLAHTAPLCQWYLPWLLLTTRLVLLHETTSSVMLLCPLQGYSEELCLKFPLGLVLCLSQWVVLLFFSPCWSHSVDLFFLNYIVLLFHLLWRILGFTLVQVPSGEVTSLEMISFVLILGIRLILCGLPLVFVSLQGPSPHLLHWSSVVVNPQFLSGGHVSDCCPSPSWNAFGHLHCI